MHLLTYGRATILAFSGTIQVDAFSVYFHFLIAAIAVVTILSSLDYFDTPHGHAGEYFALILFGSTGMMLMTSSVELLMVFVGLEISSISTYILAGFRKGRATAAESSIKYFLLGSFATAFFLYGIAMAFGATGSTSIVAIAQALSVPNATPKLAFLALGMILIGLGFKVSAAPFHVWTPDVYQGAPAPVVGFMSTAPKAAAFAVLLRICYLGFGSMDHRWATLIWVIAALSMTIGNLGALRQHDVKRMLAYSSIAHAGYLLAAFTAFPQNGISAACFYTAAYAAMNVGAFAVITQLSSAHEHHRTLEDFTGAALRRPFLGALMAFFLLSMIGIPFTGGFFAKFYVFSAAINGGHWLLAVVGLLNSGLACFYYLRLLVAMYTRHKAADPRANERATRVPPALPRRPRPRRLRPRHPDPRHPPRPHPHPLQPRSQRPPQLPHSPPHPPSKPPKSARLRTIAPYPLSPKTPSQIAAPHKFVILAWRVPHTTNLSSKVARPPHKFVI